MSAALYVIAGIIALGALLRIGQVGKEGKPVTPGGAVATVVVSAVIIAVLIAAGMRL